MATLWKERGQAVPDFTNTFHTLLYYGALHRYIQTEMDFLDISSLYVAYRYVVKIEKKFKHQNKWELGYANPQQPKYDKYIPNKHFP
jgi:hypothetical protein